MNCLLSHHHTSHGSPMVKAMPGADDDSSSIAMTTLTTTNNILLSKQAIFIIIVMLLLIIFLILIACKYKPWRFFYSHPVSSNSVFRNKNTIKVRPFSFSFYDIGFLGVLLIVDYNMKCYSCNLLYRVLILRIIG